MDYSPEHRHCEAISERRRSSAPPIRTAIKHDREQRLPAFGMDHDQTKSQSVTRFDGIGSRSGFLSRRVISGEPIAASPENVPEPVSDSIGSDRAPEPLYSFFSPSLLLPPRGFHPPNSEPAAEARAPTGPSEAGSGAGAGVTTGFGAGGLFARTIFLAGAFLAAIFFAGAFFAAVFFAATFFAGFLAADFFAAGFFVFLAADFFAAIFFTAFFAAAFFGFLAFALAFDFFAMIVLPI